MSIITWFFIVIGVAAIFLYAGVRSLVRATKGRPTIDPRIALILAANGVGFVVLAFVGLWVGA